MYHYFNDAAGIMRMILQVIFYLFTYQVSPLLSCLKSLHIRYWQLGVNTAALIIQQYKDVWDLY